MKVKQLIAKLKKMPLDTEVYFADHDQSESEVNNRVNKVELIRFDKDDPNNLWKLHGEIVTLRP